MSRSYEIDMCHGPLLKQIIIFSVPLMLSGILQLLFNAADIIVVGRFTGSEALAAVGSTSSLINLLVNLFIMFYLEDFVELTMIKMHRKQYILPSVQLFMVEFS